MSTTEMIVVQQGSSANDLPLTSMWLMVEEVDGEYSSLDGRRWNKVFAYDFDA